MMSRILITGSKSGLGAAMKLALCTAGHDVIDYDIAEMYDVCLPQPTLCEQVGRLDVLVNNAGVNRINWLENFENWEWDHVMDVNAKGIFRMSKTLLPLLQASKGTILNIISNAAHMPMRCSLAYNASKAAAHIMTLQLARELTAKDGITVFGIAPNKLAGTGMSESIDQQVMATRGWSREKAQEYQLAGLLTGEETPPAKVAELVEFLLRSKENHKYLSGCIIPYGA
jgi:meso-butanediol dehydrogenase/(S,S)-butanediol dehydrogenase/diacetyl reductase